MGPSWVSWLAFVVLAALIGVTSCQAAFQGDSGVEYEVDDATPSQETTQ